MKIYDDVTGFPHIFYVLKSVIKICALRILRPRYIKRRRFLFSANYIHLSEKLLKLLNWKVVVNFHFYIIKTKNILSTLCTCPFCPRYTLHLGFKNLLSLEKMCFMSRPLLAIIKIYICVVKLNSIFSFFYILTVQLVLHYDGIHK